LLYKRDGKEPSGGPKTREQKNRRELEQKQSKKTQREIIHRDKKRKGNQHTQIIVLAVAFISADTLAQKKKTPKTNSQQASIIFLVLKATEKKRKTQTSKHRRKSKGKQ